MLDANSLRPVNRPRLYEQVVDQIQAWAIDNGLQAGDRLPPERELASRLGVSRATVSQAFVALEVAGIVSVRHGDGVVLVEPVGTAKLVTVLRAHAQQLPGIIEARDALETKLAALAAVRRTDADIAAIAAALDEMDRDIAAGGRGVGGDELFHAAVTAAGRSEVLATLMAEISDLIRETRIASLSQPGRPTASLEGHRRVADAIQAGDPAAAARAMQEHIALVSDVDLLD
jgi:GntR family transcriptional repressor for pyruvate dehydrogenase complex